jgi:hypothetical protein
VVSADIHDFFLGSAGVAGALIGLLFVAISVSAERLARAEASAQIHRIRAYAALVAFTNALAVSLFALIPDNSIGTAALSVGIVGLLFIAASLLSLYQLVRGERVKLSSLRDAVFLIGLSVAFVIQMIAGIHVMNQPNDTSAVQTLAILVIVFFLVGISRAWELIGGPSIGIADQVIALVREESRAADPSAGGSAEPGEDPPPA